MRVVPATFGPVSISIVPLGQDSCISTISNERSDATRDATIAELNTKVQVKVTSAPTITMSEMPPLVSMREVGVGTVSNEHIKILTLTYC